MTHGTRASEEARYRGIVQIGDEIRQAENTADAIPALTAWLREFVAFDEIAVVSGSGEALPGVGFRSVLRAPLTTAEQNFGSIVLASRVEGSYPAEIREFVTFAAQHVASAMADALELRASRNLQDRLKLLLDITNRVVSRLELKDLLKEISASVRQVMRCDVAGVAILDRDTGEFVVKAMDSSSDRSGQRRPPTVVRASEVVFRTGKPVRLTPEEIASDPMITASGHKALCVLPLTSHERVLGMLGLGAVEEDAFSDDDIAFLGQIANQIALAVENALAYGEISELKERLARENVYLESEIRSELHFDDIVGQSQALKRVLAEIETVAPTDSTVLIYGETGTGKELIARAVHNLSSRKSNAFVKLNCAAIPTGLLESELFGHEKGAFTGAIAQRIGRFELAHRGTIFLDEIGEIPLELQPKLLRVLQEREFERLGSSRTVRTDARLIAATNRDLKAMADEGKFRPDLYYRLNVFPVKVPALRDRKEDIPLLVRHFVQEFSRRNNRMIETIPSDAMEALVRYPWPGNIRELQNVIERAVIISKGSVLNVAIAELKAESPVQTGAGGGKTLPEILEETERNEIMGALQDANWVISGAAGAAARLGMKRSTLQLRMQKLGIKVSRTAANGL